MQTSKENQCPNLPQPIGKKQVPNFHLQASEKIQFLDQRQHPTSHLPQQEHVALQEELICKMQNALKFKAHLISDLEQFEIAQVNRISAQTNKFSELQQRVELHLDYQDAFQHYENISKEFAMHTQYTNMCRERIQAERKSIQSAYDMLQEEYRQYEQLKTELQTACLDFARINTEQQDIILSQDKNDKIREEIVAENIQIQQLIKEKRSQLHEIVQTKRLLNNQLQELKGNIRVYCRVKPTSCSHSKQKQSCPKTNDQNQVELLKQEGGEEEEEEILDVVKETKVTLKVPKEYLKSKNDVQSHTYHFEHIYSQSVDQEMVFEELSQLVQSAIDGYNVCVFCYGQTGSGKTYTMVGELSEPQRHGIVLRGISMLVKQVEQLRQGGSQHRLCASFVEVYNEQVRSLVRAGAVTSGTMVQQKPSPHGGSEDIETVELTSEAQAFALVSQAFANRVTHGTLANEHSSRSHCLVQIKIQGTLQGTLNLVDLAGSERLSQSHVEGDRLRETQAINRSLTALSDVITALAAKQQHVPYRNSRLTRLLQDCLGGNSKTLMLLNISARRADFSQTLQSLRFAEKVLNCKSTGKVSLSKEGAQLTPASRVLANATKTSPLFQI